MKADTCSYQSVRCTLIVCNVIYLAIGAAVMSVGVFLQVSENTISYITESLAGSVILIVIGFVLIVTALLGITGIISLWLPLIIIYIFVLLVVVIVELAGVILVVVIYRSLEMGIQNYMITAINGYTGKSDEASLFVHYFQNSYNCCGYYNASDWIETSYYKNRSKFPDSCLCSSGSDVGCNITTWTLGCMENINTTIFYFSVSAGGITGVLIVVQMIAFVLIVFLCLYDAISQKKNQLNDQNI